MPKNHSYIGDIEVSDDGKWIFIVQKQTLSHHSVITIINVNSKQIERVIPMNTDIQNLALFSTHTTVNVSTYLPIILKDN